LRKQCPAEFAGERSQVTRFIDLPHLGYLFWNEAGNARAMRILEAEVSSEDVAPSVIAIAHLPKSDNLVSTETNDEAAASGWRPANPAEFSCKKAID